MTDSQKSDETAVEAKQETAVETTAVPESAAPATTNGPTTAEAAEESAAEEPVVDAVSVEETAPDPAVAGEAADAHGAAPETAATPAPQAPRRQSAVPSPAAFASRPKPAGAAPAVAPAPALAATSPAEAARWGRVEGDGHVFLRIDGSEHPVGQYPGVSDEEALAYFARKFDDVLAQIVLLEQRVGSKAPSTDMQKTVNHLRDQLAEKNMVGDIRAAEARLDTLSGQIAELERGERAEHEAIRAAELASREAIVSEAESIAGADPTHVQWKTSSARMNELFESWKTAQKSGIRLGRSSEEALWKRFRAARTVFDRHRRAYFSQLDSTNAAAKSAKEKLIAEAEALSTSTDWGYAAGEYRRLMDEWKASPRASRKDDDALWSRFRAAQDAFFTARQAANDEIDQEYSANLTVKEALLAEANSILPVRDIAAAKKQLQSIQDRWEEAGKVPRADMGRMEAGLRRVEDAVRQAEDEKWQRSNPETKARTNSALSQLEAAIAGLRDDLATAEKAGDQRKIKAAREALEAREAWLDQLQRSASELS